MSHTRVTEVLQDDLGFIWLGTLDGLRRYDGIRFKHYRPEPRRSECACSFSPSSEMEL